MAKVDWSQFTPVEEGGAKVDWSQFTPAPAEAVDARRVDNSIAAASEAETARVARESKPKPPEPTLLDRIGNEFGQLRDEFFSGVTNVSAGMTTLNTTAAANQLLKKQEELAALEAAGKGNTPEAEAARKWVSAYSARMPGMVKKMADDVGLANASSAMTTREAVKKVGEAKTFGEAWELFKEAPYDVIAGVTAQSLPAVLPALLATAATRNVGVGATIMGTNSMVQEIGSSISDYASNHGIDPSNTDALSKFLADPVKLKEAMEYAGKRGVIIGALDAASGGVASKTLAPKFLEKAAARQAVNMPAQMVTQAAFGAGGEAGAQIATEGKITQPGQVLMEAAGEFGGAPAEVLSYAKEAVLEDRKPVAPRVQDMPTTPTVPQPPANPASTPDPIGGIDDNALLGTIPVEGQNEAAQANQGPAGAPAAPAVQPAAAGVAADAAAADAVQRTLVAPGAPAGTSAVKQDGSVIPGGYDPISKLQQELADLKARTEKAIAEKKAAEEKAAAEAAAATAANGQNYRQVSATPTPQSGAVPSPALETRMVQRAIASYQKNQDLSNQNIFPERVLYGIINAPDVGPELLGAARSELERRRGTATQPTVSYSAQLQPGTTSTGVAAAAGANPVGTQAGGNAAVLGESAPGGSGRAAPGAASGTQQAARTGGIDSLPLADTAPDDVFNETQSLVYQSKKVIVRRSQRPLNYQQQVVSKLARMMGKTVTFIERASKTGEMPDGYINKFAGDHIFLDVDSSHPLLETLMHEGTHALPKHIRDKLKGVLLNLVSQEGKEAFLKKYGYTKESDFTKGEEMAAFMAQRIASNPRFFQDLRKALGNRDFAELAKVIIAKMKSWFQNTSQFDAEFLGKYVSDLQAAHDAVVEAYADAMREMGVEPDAELTAPVFAQKEDGKGRVGKVSTHVLAAQRGERVKSDKTRVGADEKAIIREAAKKMGVTIAEVEEMVRDNKAAHPASDGWAPLTLTGVKVDDDGKAELQYQTVPYSFNNDSSGTALSDGSPEYVAKVRNMAAGMLREVRGIYDRAQAGDGAAQKIIAQSGWYKEMRTRLRQEFGGMGDLFADLLGATSPNTPVRTNWDNSIEALRLATQGKFDALLPKWLTWARRVDDINTRFRARYNDMLESGMSKAAIKNDAEFKWLAEQASQIREFPDELLPLKSNGKKFGFNGKNVVRAIIDLWRVVKNADPDIRLGGTAPKAINFSGNLIGFRSRATIDVWAARMLQRLSGGLRIPSMAEGGVTGEALESGRNTLQFGFGQDVFSEAVKLIRNDPELSQDSTLRSINDDDLQALVWFIEKEVWTKGNWTSAAGEGGSFEFESDLAGVTDRDAVNQQRKIADSSVARSEEQTAAAQAEIERLTREMENFGGIPAANATLQANAEAVANKTAKPADVRASNAAAREELKKAKSTPQYKALVSERNRQKNILKKPTTEQRAQMRADAVQKLEGMSRTVDRYTAGLSIQKGAEQGMEPTPPTDAEMADLIEKVTDAVAQGDPGATVVGLKAIATEGRYGAPERALDLEVITTDEFNPAPMAAGVFSAAQEADQDAAFVARVLRPDEEFDPLLHRPGIELYFRDMNQAAEAARMMAQIPSIRLSKPSEFGPNYFAIGGYTVVVDGRPSEQARAGQMGKPVGMRVMYLPEFEARYGIDPRLENATDEELAAIVEERGRDLRNFADEVLRKFDGVSFGGRFNYEVDTRFAGEYQGAIDEYTGENGLAGAGAGKRQGGSWAGRSNRESIAAATGRLQVNGSESGAELPGGLDTQIPFSNKAGSGRAVEPDVQDGPGARPHAVRVRATHFSRQPRTSLDGRYNGTGLKGAERTRLSLATDPRIKERVYFYVDEGNGIRPESGVGGIAHSADLRNIYDVTGDPQKLFRSSNDNTNESALLDAGYDGYYVPKVFNNQGVVVVLGNASRGIKVEPTEYTKGQRPAEPEQPFKYGLTGKELNAIDMPAVQAVAPSAKLRMGTLQMAQADVAAARQELAKQGITLPADSPAFSNKALDLDQDITLEIPVEGGKTAKLTINAQSYLNQLDRREEALRMVKECMA